MKERKPSLKAKSYAKDDWEGLWLQKTLVPQQAHHELTTDLWTPRPIIPTTSIHPGGGSNGTPIQLNPFHFCQGHLNQSQESRESMEIWKDGP